MAIASGLAATTYNPGLKIKNNFFLQRSNLSYCFASKIQFLNNPCKKNDVFGQRLLFLKPRCEAVSVQNGEVESKTNSLSALELLKSSAADSKYTYMFMCIYVFMFMIICVVD